MIGHWLYKIIPASKKDVKFWNAVLWALFGNDEDGIFAEKTNVKGFEGLRPSFVLFLKWWVRNPFHNLFFHVLSFPLFYSFLLFGESDTKPYFWPKNNGFLVALNVFPFISFKSSKLEGYIGYRPMNKRAVFGMAFRGRT